MTEKYVYSFNEGNKDMRSLLGGKGANLAEMTTMGISVPYGFTVTTDACTRFYKEDEKLWEDLNNEVSEHIKDLEKENGKTFGSTEDPLLVSVRSGAPISMPGMMDTILNLGLNDDAVLGLAKKTENERFAYDSYRRFIQMFSDVAMGLDKNNFEKLLTAKKNDRGVEQDTELNADDLKELVEEYKEKYKELKGEDFPQEPREQLDLAISAVFKSWGNDRAILYRKLNDIDDAMGTAVNIQSMVFGNMGDTSGTGVAFSRNPATGENKLFGEYLINAQGEDVVAGVRTPQEIHTLNEAMPEVYEEFATTAKKLEEHYHDMQDMEFTIQEGKLFLLQTRNGKRTAHAAVKAAVDMVEEGLIDKKEAVLRVNPKDLDGLLHPTFTNEAIKENQAVAQGLAASPGAAVGKIAFTAKDAAKRASDGEQVILVREETSPEDLEGMVKANGILTARGGMTSHAAVVARGMGKCCVSGASEVHVDEDEGTMRIGDQVYTKDDTISLDGSTGDVYIGSLETQSPQLEGNFGTFMGWVDEFRDMKIRTNADTPRDVEQALDFGAEGIGLCRTEHMFFKEDRIFQVRKMILANDLETRKSALDKILPMQEDDFYQIYTLMGDKPVTVVVKDKDGKVLVEVPATIKVVETKPTPIETPVTNTPLTEDDYTKGMKIPEGGKVTKVENIPDLTTPGKKDPVKVTITLPNGKSYTVDVPVTVTPVKEIETPVTTTPLTPDDYTKGITIPEGGKVTKVENIPDLTTPGKKNPVKVTITLPNGKVVTVEVPVTVTPKSQNGDSTVQIVTEYLDENGNRITSDKEGKHNPIELEGYEFSHSTTDAKGNTLHHYKKVKKLINQEQPSSNDKKELPNTGTSTV
ncbi:MAG: pyruvate, phosphate dikinase [Anaerococcus sp.]|nr:pyruvate, phosphate dikinase [Anaerococcus sp.]